jgi:hypothetical protein
MNTEKAGTRPLEKLVERIQIFKGAENSPLLAPRGVFLVNNQLFVADTAQNRLFIWHQLPTSEFADPDVVLGQSGQAETGRNSSGKVSASSLFYPSGIWSDGNKLILADAWNHRVLIWLEMPTQNGQPADVVVGQPDFSSNDPNVKGISHHPSERSLNWPYGVFARDNQLWIADTGNRRVLYYKNIPTENFQPADAVIGKPNFTERDYDHQDPIWPYSVKIGPRGEMTITDTQYYRVLVWKNWETAITDKADVIIGQPSFEANGQNQFGWFPKAHTLNWCYDTCFYQNGLWVADTGSSRVLWFDSIPDAHNTEANNLLGQDNFNTGSENKNTIWTTEGSLYWPFQVCIENQTMVVADTGNHRIVINHLNF